MFSGSLAFFTMVLIAACPTSPAIAAPVSVAGDMQAIRQAYSDKRYIIAEQLLRDYLKWSPKDAEALYLLGNVLVLENRKSEALEPYHRAITYGSGSASARYAQSALNSLSKMDASSAPPRKEETPRLDMVRSASAADRERKQFLEKELAQEVGWRRKDMNRKITDAQLESEDAISRLPAIPCVAARSEIVQGVRADEIAAIKKRAEEKIAGIKADFEQKESELTDLYQRRIAAIDSDAQNRSSQFKVGTSGVQVGAQGSGLYVKNIVNYGQGLEAPTVPAQPAARAVAGKLSAVSNTFSRKTGLQNGKAK